MADDIFLTQEEQDERARKWLKDNGPALAIGIALGIGGIFGWEQYKDNQQTKAERASALYEQVLGEFQDSELSDIDAQFSELKSSFAGTSYAAKAALIKARQLAVTDVNAAAEELQWVVDNAPESGLQHTARIRLAKIKLSQSDLDAAAQLAAVKPQHGFASHYAEILAEVAVQRGDTSTARQELQRAIDSLSQSQAAYSRLLSIKLDRLPADENAASEDAQSSEQAPASDSDSSAEETQ